MLTSVLIRPNAGLVHVSADDGHLRLHYPVALSGLVEQRSVVAGTCTR